MRIKKRFLVLILAVFLILSMSITVYAHEVPDNSRTGSIAVTMTYGGKAVSGGILTLYQVGEIYENDGNYSFVLTGDFKASGISLEDPESSKLAADLTAYVAANSLRGTEAGIGDDGKAMAAGLPLGLYLIVQTKSADGYEAVAPFLVSVPMNEGGTYIYDVDATPKMSLLKEKPPVPATPTEPTLPQTGQLNWPVPVLAVLGLCLFFLGWVIRFDKKEMPYEA